MIPEVGRPTELNDELFAKIRDCVMQDMNYGQTADTLGIPKDTFYKWTSNNYLDFRKKWEYYEEERLLELAGYNLKKVAVMDTSNAEGKEDPQLLKIQADVAKWTKETLNADRYSKQSKVDHSTKGKEMPQPILHVLLNNDSNKEDSEA
jgi:hypothetical protein